MKAVIPYARQSISEDDINTVVDVLRSDYLTQGPRIGNFEKAVADYCGSEYAVAVNSGTSALHIACLTLGVRPGDVVWTSPNSFVASANCALYCGAKVDFVDIDKHTYNISVSALEDKLRVAKKNGKLPKVLIVVHFAGQSCEMEAISRLSNEYDFFVVEDASHAIGGSYKDVKIGACTLSDMTVFSFHPVKIVTTAEGGMLLTNNESLYDGLCTLRTHGITRNSNLMEGASHGPWYYQQVDLGYNYRMTDLQAALGLSQMQRIDDFVGKRHEIAKYYNMRLKDLPLIIPWQHPDTYSSFHLYVVKLCLDSIRKTHLQVFSELRENGIGVNLHYVPIHTQPYYTKLGFRGGDFPVAEEYYKSAISIPMYYDLSRDQQDRVVKALGKVVR
jgi:UDP-4-amino-4,6-dideoxy-N-acetyl-beta-L-altrosamine transaminase